MTKYHNEGWFGKHPAMYEFASFFISSIRRNAAKKMSEVKLKILDIATGTGAHALELAKLNHSVTGIDLDKQMLVKANKKLHTKLNLEFSHGDGTDTGFENSSFDAATISFAMHDVPHDIGIKILEEAKRVINKSGFIYIVDYNDLKSLGSRILYLFAHFYESPNYKPFVKRGLPIYLEQAGFKVSHKSTFLGAVQFVKASPILAD